jgi:hypothetical protein
MDCPIIQHLAEWHASLACQTVFPSVEQKAEHIGLMNRIETAMARLKLCEKHDIYTGAWICVLPPVAYQNAIPEYRVVCDGESDNPAHWKEVSFEKRGIVRLTGGDIVIKK